MSHCSLGMELELTTGVLLHDLERLQDFSWVRACVTAFADDIHGGDLVSTPQQLEALVCKILKINTIKSVFLIRFTFGFAPPPAPIKRRRHIVRSKDGDHRRFRSP